MLLTELNELKAYLELDPADSSPDLMLNFLIQVASEWIEEWLNRPHLSYQQHVEYLDGRGTQKLVLGYRPVFVDTNRPISVVIDYNGGYGQIPGGFSDPPLTYGKEYFLRVDQPDGVKSRCGLLIRNGGTWPRPYARSYGLLTPYLSVAYGAIQVTYWAGYTVDDLPAPFRFAVNTLVARMRFLLPIGFPLSGDTYEEKTISILQGEKDYLMGLVVPMLQPFRNWSFGGTV